MIKVMCNTSPIIGLSILGKLNLLWELFEAYIPEEVYREITQENESLGAKELEQAVIEGKIKIYSVKDKQFVNKAYGILHRGELEVVIGAIEIDIKVVIIDERAARNFAETLNLKPTGLIGILKIAKTKGKIDSIKPYLDLLIQKKFRISEKLYNEALKELGETGI